MRSKPTPQRISLWRQATGLGPIRTTLSLLCTAAMMTPGIALQQAPAQPLVRFEQYTLENGLTVILHEGHSAPVAAVVVMYHVGSKNEKVKRTGFAHLFEHMMFQGSEHVRDDEHFKLLQEIGAVVNGTTSNDRTNYFEVVPSNYLELALYLESDRLGFLLPAMTQEKLDNQRDVVKNERRQGVDNVPYGTAGERIDKALYPEGHPYSWPVIGYMEDLSAASSDDVKGFFQEFYAPNNTVVVIAGDIHTKQTKDWILKYFGPLPTGHAIERPKVQPVMLTEDKRIVFEDKVQLPRLYITWPSARMLTRDDAVMDVMMDILASGKNSRLYKSLVYEQQIAQTVVAYQNGAEIAGEASIQVTAKPGITLTEIESKVNAELARLFKEGVTEKEIQTSLNAKESQLVNNLTTMLGKANSLASYYTYTGDAGNINREFERFKGITEEELLTAARRIFAQSKVVLSVVPEGRMELAAHQTKSQTK